jgi:hypothetical protein
MPSETSGPVSKRPAVGAPFNPRELFGSLGIGAFIPERVAASPVLTMTAKVCYGHLIRRAGKNDRCWPSYRDIAQSTGIGERQAMRALKELADAQLVRPVHRADQTGRQTSNAYEFIWGPILAGEGDVSDTLPGVKSDRGSVPKTTPTRVSRATPLEVIKKNHHQGSAQGKNHHQRSSPEKNAAQTDPDAHGYPEPETAGSSPSRNSEFDDDDSITTKYASARDELKTLAARNGSSLRVADLDWIEARLGNAGLDLETFVTEARGHSWDRISNPVAFLKDLAKNFRAKVQPTSPPVTAAEAREKNYRCPKCGSRVRGQGAVLIVGKVAPCSCASPEWITRQRARGVFPEEPTQ